MPGNGKQPLHRGLLVGERHAFIGRPRRVQLVDLFADARASEIQLNHANIGATSQKPVDVAPRMDESRPAVERQCRRPRCNRRWRGLPRGADSYRGAAPSPLAEPASLGCGLRRTLAPRASPRRETIAIRGRRGTNRRARPSHHPCPARPGAQPRQPMRTRFSVSQDHIFPKLKSE